MKERIDELIARIRILQNELESEYRNSLEAFALRRAQLASDFLLEQQRYKISVLKFLMRARPLVALTSPVIYLGWIPFILMDIFVTLFQSICFPVYHIPKVRRSDYLVFDREDLPYLNVIEKFNCFYCSYGNGIAAYAQEVAARTEQYWCPIKHARRIRSAHKHYPKFFTHGDAEAFRQGLDRLRKQLEEDDTR